MKLNILERIMLQDVLATIGTGNYINLKLVQNLRMKVGFTSQELKKANLRENAGSFTWDKDFETTFQFDDKTKEIIVKQLTDLNSKEQLKPGHLSLYEKFVGVENGE